MDVFGDTAEFWILLFQVAIVLDAHGGQRGPGAGQLGIYLRTEHPIIAI